jgi:hypothetical protein
MGLNNFRARHSLWRFFRTVGLDPESGGYAITDTIEILGGAKPKTFEAFMRQERSALMAQAGQAPA